MTITSDPVIESQNRNDTGDAPANAGLVKGGVVSPHGTKPLVHDLYDITPEGYRLLTQTDLWRRPVLPVNTEWVVGFTGPRGGGKSLEAAYMACRDYLIRGRPVWSNIPMRIELKLANGEVVVAEAMALDTQGFFSLSEDLKGGLVVIDELELYAEARRSGSNKNLLLTYIIMQTRKRALSFFYTIQQPHWTDNRLQFMSDVMIRSRDIAYTPWGFEKKIGRGQYFSMIVEDWSGMLTGYRYQETGYNMTFCLWGVPVWGTYNSYDVVDVFDALTPVDLNLNRMRISTGDTKEEQDNYLEKLNDRIGALRMAGFHEIKDDELWNVLQIEENERRGHGKMLKALGVTKKQKGDGAYYYQLPEYANEEGVGAIVEGP